MAEPSVNKVFVGNLPFSVTEDQVMDLFSSVGEVSYADIPLNPQGLSKGFALVEFVSEESVTAAIEKFNQTDFAGRTIYVKKDEGPKQRSSSRSPVRNKRADRPPRENYEHKAPTGDRDFRGFQVYVGNLPWRTSWQDLKDEFSKFGEVLRTNVIRDESGRSKGFGTVRFANEEDALKAIAEMDQQDFNGRAISVRKDRYQEQK